MILALPSQLLKSAMKGWKWVKLAHIAKLRVCIESEDDKDPVIQVCCLVYFLLSLIFHSQN